MNIKKMNDKINNALTNKIKVIVGIVCIIAAIVVDAVGEFANSYNGMVTIILTLGLISLVNALFSKIYDSSFSYILFMVCNIAGLLLYMLVISKYEVIGGLFVGLFCLLVFVCMWMADMALLTRVESGRRILGGFLANALVLVSTALAAGLVVTASVIVNMKG